MVHRREMSLKSGMMLADFNGDWDGMQASLESADTGNEPLRCPLCGGALSGGPPGEAGTTGSSVFFCMHGYHSTCLHRWCSNNVPPQPASLVAAKLKPAGPRFQRLRDASRQRREVRAGSGFGLTEGMFSEPDTTSFLGIEPVEDEDLAICLASGLAGAMGIMAPRKESSLEDEEAPIRGSFNDEGEGDDLDAEGAPASPDDQRSSSALNLSRGDSLADRERQDEWDRLQEEADLPPPRETWCPCCHHPQLLMIAQTNLGAAQLAAHAMDACN